MGDALLEDSHVPTLVRRWRRVGDVDNRGGSHIGMGVVLGQREKVGSGGILFFLEGFFSRGAIDVGARGEGTDRAGWVAEGRAGRGHWYE